MAGVMTHFFAAGDKRHSFGHCHEFCGYPKLVSSRRLKHGSTTLIDRWNVVAAHCILTTEGESPAAGLWELSLNDKESGK